MKIMKIKIVIFIILISQFILCNNANDFAYSMSGGNKLKNYKIPKPQELNKAVDQLVESIIKIDIDSIIKILHEDRVEIWRETRVKKENIINELKLKKDLYSYLFDTIKYRELESKLTEGPVSAFCIRDQLLMARKKI